MMPRETPDSHEPSSALRQVLIAGIVAMGVTVLVVTVGEKIFPASPFNYENFTAVGEGWDKYMEIRKEWRPRVLSMVFAGGLYRLLGADPGAAFNTVQIWLLVGVLSTLVACIVWTDHWAVFYILGTGVGLLFGYNPAKVTYLYPWDLPALLFFTLAVLQLRVGRPRRLFWLLPLAVLFKETAIVLTLAFLFEDLSWRLRLRRFAIAFALCLAAKLLCNLVVGLSDPVTSVTATENGHIRLVENLRCLFRGPALLVNGGTLLAFLLLPGLDRRLLMLKTIALAFIACMFVYGVIEEYRIWFEMIPLSLWGFEMEMRKAVRRALVADDDRANPPDEKSPRES